MSSQGVQAIAGTVLALVLIGGTSVLSASLLRGSSGTGWSLIPASAGLFLTGAVCAALIYLATGSPLWAGATGIAVSAAAGAALLDWTKGHIADFQSMLIFVCGLVAAPWLHPGATWIIALGGGGAALAILLLAMFLVRLRQSVNGMGQGDFGLAAAGGVWCGVGFVGPALLAAVVVTLIIRLAFRRGEDPHLPFAPGLVIGFALAALIGVGLS